jgi:DNA-binding transcriptional LysR family regulator
MAENEPDWDLIRTFLAAMRTGSFSAAARELGLAQPTAGRQIETLEAKTGAPLFIRSRRGLIPTPAALALLPHAEAMAAAAAALSRTSSAEAHDERGTVRLTASQLIGHEVLPPILTDFCVRYRDIQIELAVSDHNADLLRRDADIAVRMTRPTQQALVARRMGVIEIGLYAQRRYVEAFGLPHTQEELTKHRSIGFDRDPHAVHSAGGSATQVRRHQFGFRTDSASAQVAALRAGIGICAYHTILARRDPNLLRVLEGVFSVRREMWLVMHRDSRSVRRIKVLFDYLARALSSYTGQSAAAPSASVIRRKRKGSATK